jgi:hypothetical protein
MGTTGAPTQSMGRVPEMLQNDFSFSRRVMKPA